MIYVVRHQEGGSVSNCLSNKGVCKTRAMARFFARKHNTGRSHDNIFKTVYTITPRGYKHVRPVQTAATLCSHLNRLFYHTKFSVMTCDTEEQLSMDVLDFKEHDIVVVWHHGGMQSIVDAISHTCGITKTVVCWPDYNYDGCVEIDTVRKTVFFNHDMFSSHWGFSLLLCT